MQVHGPWEDSFTVGSQCGAGLVKAACHYERGAKKGGGKPQKEVDELWHAMTVR